MTLILHKWGGAAEPNSASKPSSVVLLVCLGEGGRERHSAAWLPEQVSVSPFCFTGWEDLFCPCGQSGPCWAVVFLLGCVSSWDRCLVRGTLGSLDMSERQPCSTHASGNESTLQGSPAVMPFCGGHLLPVWRYPLKTRGTNMCPSIFVWKAPILPFLFRSVSMKRNACELSYCTPSVKEM